MKNNLLNVILAAVVGVGFTGMAQAQNAKVGGVQMIKKRYWLPSPLTKVKTLGVTPCPNTRF